MREPTPSTNPIALKPDHNWKIKITCTCTCMHAGGLQNRATESLVLTVIMTKLASNTCRSRQESCTIYFRLRGSRLCQSRHRPSSEHVLLAFEDKETLVPSETVSDNVKSLDRHAQNLVLEKKP